MASEIQWMYITDKYTLVEIIDNAIVVARFNQKELMRDLIETRSKILKSKSYDEIVLILDQLLDIDGQITDKRLSDVVARLVDRITALKDNELRYDEKIREAESRASD